MTFYVPFPGGIYGLLGILIILLVALFVVWVIQRLRALSLSRGLTVINAAYVDLQKRYTLDVTQLSPYAQESDYFRGKSKCTVYRCGYDPKSCRAKSDDFLVVTQEMVDARILRPILVDTSSLS